MIALPREFTHWAETMKRLSAAELLALARRVPAHKLWSEAPRDTLELLRSLLPADRIGAPTEFLFCAKCAEEDLIGAISEAGYWDDEKWQMRTVRFRFRSLAILYSTRMHMRTLGSVGHGERATLAELFDLLADKGTVPLIEAVVPSRPPLEMADDQWKDVLELMYHRILSHLNAYIIRFLEGQRKD